MIYVAQAEKNGDIFEIVISTDKDYAISQAIADREHQSNYDRKLTKHFVCGYDYPDIPDYLEALYDGELKDPTDYEEIQ